MAEGGESAGAKVRVVRCPKCGKLLPELAGFSVYRCGGCNAILQAKRPVVATRPSSEKSDAERDRNSENSGTPSSSMEKIPSIENHHEADQENHRVGTLDNERVPSGDLDGFPTSRTDLNDCNENPITTLDKIEGHSNACPDVKQENCGVEASTNETAVQEIHGSSRGCTTSGSDSDDHGKVLKESETNIHDCSPTVENQLQHRESWDYNGIDMAGKATIFYREGRGSKKQVESIHGTNKTQKNRILSDENRNRKLGPYKTSRPTAQGARFSPYPDEGPSNYQKNSSYGRRKYSNSGFSNKITKQDQAEILRKLDELRYELSRTCEDVNNENDRPSMKERGVSANPYELHGSNGRFHKIMSSVNQPLAQHFALVNGYDMDLNNHRSTMHAQYENSRYREPVPTRKFKHATYQSSCHYQQRASIPYAYDQFNPDIIMSHSHDMFYHQPACSCTQCFNDHWHMPSQAPVNGFSNKRGPYLADTQGFYPVDNADFIGYESFKNRSANSLLLSHHPQDRQRFMFNRQAERTCQPLVGGAPFIVCYNCLELLQLPHNLLRKRDPSMLRCGVCSKVIMIEVGEKQLKVLAHATTEGITSEANKGTVNGITEGMKRQLHLNHGISYSGDYGDSVKNTQSSERNPVLSPLPFIAGNEIEEKEYCLNDNETENMEGSMSSPGTSKNGSNEASLNQMDVPNSKDIPLKSKANSCIHDSSLHEQFSHPSSVEAVNGPGDGSRSKHFDEEKVFASGNFRQTHVKDVKTATVVELPIDEYPDPDFSYDSREESKAEIRQRMSKGGSSFFAGIKKSFKDFSRSSYSPEHGRYKVSVNGHTVPDRSVRKAEKQAGPIHPGDYWYDYRAGFWGVMGQPCLGIIPPYIEEFNYPPPKDCAGGNTSVLVNGRELNEKDLDLLISRGLPNLRERSYIIEISGRVLDAVSGEDVGNLGQLAPTIMKRRLGFGMRDPKINTV